MTRPRTVLLLVPFFLISLALVKLAFFPTNSPSDLVPTSRKLAPGSPASDARSPSAMGGTWVPSARSSNPEELAALYGLEKPGACAISPRDGRSSGEQEDLERKRWEEEAGEEWRPEFGKLRAWDVKLIIGRIVGSRRGWAFIGGERAAQATTLISSAGLR